MYFLRFWLESHASLAQPVDEGHAHGTGWREDAAALRDVVEGEAEGRFTKHFGGGAVTWVEVVADFTDEGH